MLRDFGRRVLLPMIRHSVIWWVAPVLLGIDLFVAFQRGLEWRGELAFAVETLGPSLFLLSPFLAGVGAWEVRRDATRLGPVVLAVASRGDWHARFRIVAAALVAISVQITVLGVMAVISLTRARIGELPIGSATLQLFAIAAFISVGAVIGRMIAHPVAPVIAAVIALVATYADDSLGSHLPLGFMDDDTTVSLFGAGESPVAVLARLLWCTGIVLVALAVLRSQLWVRWRRSVAIAAAGSSLIGLGSLGILAHQSIWVPSHRPVASRCSGTNPQICVPVDYAAHLDRVARIVTIASTLLRGAGAEHLPTRYVGWSPTAPDDANLVYFIHGVTADEPATPAEIAAGVVAPTSCPQWTDPVTGPPDGAFVAQSLIVAWLAEQDPQFTQPTRPPQLRAFIAQPADRQASWVARAETDLATCQLDAIPAAP